MLPALLYPCIHSKACFLTDSLIDIVALSLYAVHSISLITIFCIFIGNYTILLENRIIAIKDRDAALSGTVGNGPNFCNKAPSSVAIQGDLYIVSLQPFMPLLSAMSSLSNSDRFPLELAEKVVQFIDSSTSLRTVALLSRESPSGYRHLDYILV